MISQRKQYCVRFLSLPAMLVVAPPAAMGCEPILPFIKVVGGPGILTNSWLLLCTAVLTKTIIFAILQSDLSRTRAGAYMLAGNVLTTIIGVVAAAMIGSGSLILFGMFFVWGLSLVPARRLIDASMIPWLRRVTPGLLAAMMSFGLVVSCVLFALSAEFVDSSAKVIYWFWKLAAIYPALIISIVLTAFWEEWVIWKLAKRRVGFLGFVRPVIRANLVVLLGVMLIAAAMAMPARLKSRDFLVSLFTQGAVTAQSR